MSYYVAESENGGSIEDPSEDALFEMVSELALPDNGFITIEPPGGRSHWYVVISLLPDLGYEVEYRNALKREHRLVSESDCSEVAQNVTIWLAVPN